MYMYISSHSAFTLHLSPSPQRIRLCCIPFTVHYTLPYKAYINFIPSLPPQCCFKSLVVSDSSRQCVDGETPVWGHGGTVQERAILVCRVRDEPDI